MATTVVPVTQILGPYPTLPVTALALDVPLQAADVANQQHALAAEGDILIVFNSDVTGRTFTLTSVKDGLNRTGDVTAYAIGAGLMSAFKIGTRGWIDPTTAKFLFGANNAAVKFAIIRPPL